MKTLTAEQLAAFFPGSQEQRCVRDVLSELVTGLRRGELLGLKWEDVNLNYATLTIRRQITRINGEVVSPTENENSYRTPVNRIRCNRNFDRPAPEGIR